MATYLRSRSTILPMLSTARSERTWGHLLRQYLCVCTSKASKEQRAHRPTHHVSHRTQVHHPVRRVREEAQRVMPSSLLLRQYVYFCTSFTVCEDAQRVMPSSLILRQYVYFCPPSFAAKLGHKYTLLN